MKENNYYWLINGAEKTLVYYYRNPDAYMNPEKPILKKHDYSALGFGFNIADGGGFLFENDLVKGAEVIDAKINSKWVGMKNEN